AVLSRRDANRRARDASARCDALRVRRGHAAVLTGARGHDGDALGGRVADEAAPTIAVVRRRIARVAEGQQCATRTGRSIAVRASVARPRVAGVTDVT